MRVPSLVRHCVVCLLAFVGGLAIPVEAQHRTVGMQHRAAGAPTAQHGLTPDEEKALIIYRAKLLAYRQARAPYERKAAAYWDRISATRKARRAKRARGGTITLADYVLDQPPVYSGPPEPVAPPFLRPKDAGKPRRDVPVVADFLRHAREQFGFVPDKPAAETDYKRAYAWEALAAGISRDQAVRIYGFEASGNGLYDVQAGLEKPGPGRRAITTALGYNQLLATNTVSLLANHGPVFLDGLSRMASRANGRQRARLEEKHAVLRRMIAFSHSVRNDWYAHEHLARTAKGLGAHALNLDVDIGPMLQAQKLLDSIRFAQKHGHSGRLSAAELETMNLMGDGSGLDVVLMPLEMRDKVPTSNFFLRQGYERNPVVIRNNVVASLLAAMNAKMDQQAALPGAREMEAAFDTATAQMRNNAARR